MPGHLDFQGIQLVHGVDILDAPAGLIILGNNQVHRDNLINRPGYQLTLTGTIGNTATIPFYIVKVQFWDAAVAHFIDETDWIVPADTTGGVTHILRGPVRGPLIRCVFQNLDPSVSVTVAMVLSETTHHIARDDMRVASVAANTVMPVYTLFGNAYPQNAQLGVGTFSQPATTTTKFLDYIYAGEVQYSYNASGTTVVLQLRVPDVLPASVGGNSLIWSDTLNSNPFSHLLVSPRCPVMVSVNNPSAGALTVNFAAYALEYAS